MASKKVSQLSSLEATKPVKIEVDISQKHYKLLEKLAKEKGRSVEYYLKTVIQSDIENYALYGGMLCAFVIMCSTYGVYNAVMLNSNQGMGLAV